MDIDLDKIDPHGHGLDSEMEGTGETEVAYRMEQAFLRGFSHGIASIVQFWERHKPDDVNHAMDEIESAQDWAMEQRWALQREPKRRLWMLDALQAEMAKMRAKKR